MLRSDLRARNRDQAPSCLARLLCLRLLSASCEKLGLRFLPRQCLSNASNRLITSTNVRCQKLSWKDFWASSSHRSPVLHGGCTRPLWVLGELYCKLVTACTQARPRQQGRDSLTFASGLVKFTSEIHINSNLLLSSAKG